MQRILKFIGVVAGAWFVLYTLTLAYALSSNYFSVFFIAPSAKVYNGGKRVSGWIHECSKCRAYILTRNDRDKRESYWISLGEKKPGSVRSCDDWAASRFPVIMIGDVNPPCFSFVIVDEHNPPPKTPSRDSVFGNRSVEFNADDGSRIRAEW